jgi:hypothetical protein
MASSAKTRPIWKGRAGRSDRALDRWWLWWSSYGGSQAGSRCGGGANVRLDLTCLCSRAAVWRSPGPPLKAPLSRRVDLFREHSGRRSCTRHGVGCQHDASFLIRHMAIVAIVRPRNVTHGDAARCHARRHAAVSVRVVLTCRACAEVTVLDLHAAVIARRYPGVPLARFSWRCSACLSDDLDIDVRPEPSQRRG